MSHIKRSRGFSLIELLSVLAIITILAAATVPALKGTLDGFNISGAADMTGAELSLARQTAMSRNLPVEVRIYKIKDTTGDEYRVIALVVPKNASHAANDEWITPGKLLPGNVLFDRTNQYSTVISEGEKNPSTADPRLVPWYGPAETAVPNLLKDSTYVAFQYSPDGSTNLPPGQPWCLTLRNLNPKVSQVPNTPAANYVSIVIDSLTGRTLTYQP